ncbi:helix-turn-helix domain-containing protein [Streptomyces huasconensis]|uniref:helix-turn-helix domain-containing protein n=1 Tax=Streptomyces huasconensis TaxID=1854574 RepID=UPI0034119494
MGRREKPVDQSHPARGRLAVHLRGWRKSAGVTYERLARLTGLSPATLKRAASGSAVPRRTTVETYVEGCGGGQEAVRAADELWRQARVEERGRLAQLRAPRPELIGDGGDLSRALEVVWEQAGAPSLREIKDRSGNPLALPVSSLARIVNRDAIPADEQQLQAFLTGCGIPPERHTPWLSAFTKITRRSLAVAVGELPDEWSRLRSQAALRRQRTTSRLLAVPSTAQPRHTSGSDQQWRDFLSLLDPATRQHIVANGVHSYLASQAARNGKTTAELGAWQPDYLVHHNGKHMVIEVKSTSNPPGRPPAGGATGISPRSPSSGGGSPAARAQPPPAEPPHALAAAS